MKIAFPKCYALNIKLKSGEVLGVKRKYRHKMVNKKSRDFPDGPEVKTPLPLQPVWASSLVRGAKIPFILIFRKFF